MKMKLSLIIFNQFKWVFGCCFTPGIFLSSKFPGYFCLQSIVHCSQGPGTVIFYCQFLGSYPSSIWAGLGKASSAKFQNCNIFSTSLAGREPELCSPVSSLCSSLQSAFPHSQGTLLTPSSRSSWLSPSLAQGIPQEQRISWTVFLRGFLCEIQQAEVLRFGLSHCCPMTNRKFWKLDEI